MARLDWLRTWALRFAYVQFGAFRWTLYCLRCTSWVRTADGRCLCKRSILTLRENGPRPR